MGRPSAIWLVVRQAPHHAGVSGYHRLAAYLAEAAGAVAVTHGFPRRGTWRLADPLARRSGLSWYGPEACLTEVWAAGLAGARGGLVHFLYGENSYRYAGALRLPRRGRLVASYHLPPSVFGDHVRRRDHLARLDAVIFVASSQLPLLEGLRGRPAAHVIPHGVDTAFFRPPAEAPAAGPCLFVGQMLRDFPLLEKVVEGVRRAEPAARFVLVLPEELAAAWRGRPGVEVRTGIPDASLRQAYQEARLLVMPLRDCTANNSLLEAMASGLPAVITDVGGVRDYVDPGCARLVPPGRAEAMVEAVVDLLADGPARAALGGQARRRAEGFAWPVVARKILAVYRGLGWRPGDAG